MKTLVAFFVVVTILNCRVRPEDSSAVASTSNAAFVKQVLERRYQHQPALKPRGLVRMRGGYCASGWYNSVLSLEQDQERPSSGNLVFYFDTQENLESFARYAALFGPSTKVTVNTSSVFVCGRLENGEG